MKTLEQLAVRRLPVVKATGLGLILLSLLLFMLPEWGVGVQQDMLFGLFMMNYGIAVLYFIMLLVQKEFKIKRSGKGMENICLLLVLLLMSAFSLNRELPLFQDSATWLEIYLVLLAVGLVGYAFRDYYPKPLLPLPLFLLGAGLTVCLYYAVYLAPYYVIGVVAFFVFGISLHLLLPLFMAICLVFICRYMYEKHRPGFYAFVGGFAATVLYAVVFLLQWQAGNSHLNQLSNDYTIAENTQLPRWVYLSQQLPQHHITEKLIKSDLVYQVPSGNIDSWNLPTNSLDELMRHDPLVMLSAFMAGRPELEETERIKILESMYDARHHALERLWSGTDLSTSNIISQTKIYPQHRISYTEKVLSIKNNSTFSRSQQEAIYTFFLPEGGVVTSLSLWINGQEEKGYLTTKSKADSAYTTIVGVESRDPSVVHWQEGNTVSVRVFPCTPLEVRRVKIGITAPLREEGNQLVYDNIYFQGPATTKATETAVVYLENVVQHLDLPSAFAQEGTQQFKRHGAYEQDWQLRFDTPLTGTNSFTFNGQSYRLAVQEQPLEPFEAKRIYLDINKAWSKSELQEVYQALSGKKVYVYDGQLVRVTDENREMLFERLQRLNYSLFPLHLMKEPEQALLISISTEVSPNLVDLKDSPFAEAMAKGVANQAPIRFYNLGPQLSPYLKSLKELQVIAGSAGTPKQLQQLLDQKQFVSVKQDAQAVRLGESGLKIEKTETVTASAAPDHLLRLFAYNHILQQIGTRYFTSDFLEESLLQEAQIANIVSPVSSLIVLETQEDYERFGIEESKDSLGNAQMKSAGAVPEPEEWLLIVLVVLVVGSLLHRHYLLR